MFWFTWGDWLSILLMSVHHFTKDMFWTLKWFEPVSLQMWSGDGVRTCPGKPGRKPFLWKLWLDAFCHLKYVCVWGLKPSWCAGIGEGGPLTKLVCPWLETNLGWFGGQTNEFVCVCVCVNFQLLISFLGPRARYSLVPGWQWANCKITLVSLRTMNNRLERNTSKNYRTLNSLCRDSIGLGWISLTGSATID